jgi:hypothetical protein
VNTTIVFFVFFFSFAPLTFAQDWKSSPNNWENSPNNWQNSPNNWQNSPQNWNNSPMRFGSDRIIRDENGNAAGYVVPKSDGGANIFDLNGRRRGYLPSR